MCVLLITRLLRGVGRWARKPVNHTSWVVVVTPTDRPKSVRNCCLIELFCGVVCVATLSLWHFCWYRGFCHRTGSDLLLFVFMNIINIDFWKAKSAKINTHTTLLYIFMNDKWKGWQTKYDDICVTLVYEYLCQDKGHIPVAALVLCKYTEST